MRACTPSKVKRYEINRTLMPYKVHIVAVIWPENQHKLFDFDSNSYFVKEIEVDFSCILIRYSLLALIATVDKELVALTQTEQAENSTELVNITMNEQDAYINCISEQQDHKLWAVLKLESNQFSSIEHRDLKIGDIIKLGRVRMELLEYSFMTPCDEATQYQDEQEDEVQTINDVFNCTICFSSRATETNPLIRPCKCEGSVKYIHLECLQSWVRIELKIKYEEHSIQYLWKRLDFEICKATFRSIYKFQDKTYSVLKLPKSSYITFKITNDDTTKEAMIYVVEIGEKTELKIGRIPDCDFKLRDISVSRTHAILKLIPTSKHTPETPDYIIRIQDNKSKFGTHVLAQDQDLLKISDEGTQPIVLFQTGRVLLQCTKKKKLNQNSSYKHPENITLTLNQTKLQFEQQEVQESFVKHDDLKASDITLNNSQHFCNNNRARDSK
ncbi:unnamed protein product (macronuclear) [Paramecium tetraurelia]|uniref:RING-CH-type domain-containing protein n=1 Tax=Paramecium tetraurelia TaxID=5888 RepID=A0DYH7_PARTE|nr:uncharacterized protein GSPATT00003062001 [Paramecium tetraurelia]CAK88094.1 unnamed protein product [Paramecium tetraurelia]|eukprot:XP_001455491.1 hypothetical protein (macronuclear) [Paramecium tetraurelia strain d4-2]